MKRVKIAQYGVTHEHASAKMQTLRSMSDVFEFVGVVDDLATSKVDRWPHKLDMSQYDGIPRLTPEEMFNYPGLQAVAVEVANDELVSTARKCLAHHLPTHMDKPGGQSLEDFVALSKGYEAEDLPFQMGYMFRCNPAIRYCVDFVKKGLLGEVFFVEADMNHCYGDDDYQAYLGTFQGGILYNLCSHHLDYITAMLGRPTKVTHFPGTIPGTPCEAENNSLAVLEYGACKVLLKVSCRETNATRVLKITGTKGMLELRPVERFDGQPLLLSLNLREPVGDFPAGNHTLNFGVQTDRYRGQFEDLAKIINGEMPNPQIYAHDQLVEEVLLQMCK